MGSHCAYIELTFIQKLCLHCAYSVLTLCLHLYSNVSTMGSHYVLKKCIAHCILVHCRPDDGRLTTETCCLNEYNIRLPVTRILIEQLCLTLLSEDTEFSNN